MPAFKIKPTPIPQYNREKRIAEQAKIMLESEQIILTESAQTLDDYYCRMMWALAQELAPEKTIIE